MTYFKFRIPHALFVGLFVLSCGNNNQQDWQTGLVDFDYEGEPLFEISGRVTNENNVQFDPPLRVALLWLHPSTLETGIIDFEVQEVEIVPEFPSLFTFSIMELPSEELLTPAPGYAPCLPDEDPNALMADAIAIAYQDTNQNQKLDQISATAPEPIDVVLGQLELSIVYLESLTPIFDDKYGDGGIYLQPGLNFIDILLDPLTGRPIRQELVPTDTEVEIVMSEDPLLSFLLCEEGISSSESIVNDAASWPPVEDDYFTTLPDDVYIKCSNKPNGNQAVNITYYEIVNPIFCEVGLIFHYLNWQVEAGAVPPPGWPCE